MLVEKKFSKTSLLSIQAINIIFLFDIFCTFILFLAKTATFFSKYCSAVLRKTIFFVCLVFVCVVSVCGCVLCGPGLVKDHFLIEFQYSRLEGVGGRRELIRPRPVISEFFLCCKHYKM